MGTGLRFIVCSCSLFVLTAIRCIILKQLSQDSFDNYIPHAAFYIACMSKNIIYIDPELVLWIEVIDNYVYDFCCLSCLLIIQRFYEPKTQKEICLCFWIMYE